MVSHTVVSCSWTEGAVPALNYLLAALAKNISLLLLFIMLLYEPSFEKDEVLGADLNGGLHALWPFATVINNCCPRGWS